MDANFRGDCAVGFFESLIGKPRRSAASYCPPPAFRWLDALPATLGARDAVLHRLEDETH
jgi:hypothetical protein